MAVIPHSRLVALRNATRRTPEISIPLINNPPGKYCLVDISGKSSSAISSGGKID
jgi:hypothetical protein